MLRQKANHDGCRRTENNHPGPPQSCTPRRIHLVDHPFLLGFLKGLFIGIDSDDMLRSDAPQAPGEGAAHEAQSDDGHRLVRIKTTSFRIHYTPCFPYNSRPTMGANLRSESIRSVNMAGVID